MKKYEKISEDEVKIQKTRIFYSRTYRYLNSNKKMSILYILFLVLPCFVAMVLFHGQLSVYVSDFAAMVLKKADPDITVHFTTVEFIPLLKKIKVVAVPTTYPSFGFTVANIGVSLLLLFFFLHGKRKSRPVGIFLAIMVFIHIINCAYFLFGTEQFPYTAEEYAGLYMEQQVGIWISFLLIGGLVTGLLGHKLWISRIATFFGIMAYSFVFGVLRYILSLYIIYRFSVLYIAIFFFALGPFFDFLYLVSIYGFYVNRMIAFYDGQKGMEEWKWS